MDKGGRNVLLLDFWRGITDEEIDECGAAVPEGSSMQICSKLPLKNNKIYLIICTAVRSRKPYGFLLCAFTGKKLPPQAGKSVWPKA